MARSATQHPAGQHPAGQRSAGQHDAGQHDAGQHDAGQHEAGRRSPAHEMLDRDAASNALGIELVEAGHGRATARMRVTGEMVNGHGMTHGGFVFILADTAFACACNSHGPVTVAAGADISFLRPTREGDLLTAYAQERATNGRSGIYDVTVTCDGDVVAEFRGRSRQISPALPDPPPARAEANPPDASRTAADPPEAAQVVADAPDAARAAAERPR